MSRTVVCAEGTAVKAVGTKFLGVGLGASQMGESTAVVFFQLTPRGQAEPDVVESYGLALPMENFLSMVSTLNDAAYNQGRRAGESERN